MPYATEVTALTGTVIAVLTVILGLRLTHFRSRIASLRSNVSTAKSATMQSLGTEIKKGYRADVELVLNLADRISSLDRMRDALDEIDQSMRRGFFLDFGAIALLVGVAVISIVETQFDILSQVLLFIVALFVFVVFSSFVQSVRDLFRVEGRLRAKTK